MSLRMEAEQVTIGLGEGQKINCNTLHQMLGHVSEDKLRVTAKHGLGVNWKAEQMQGLRT